MTLLARIDSMLRMRSHVDPLVCDVLRDCKAEIVSLREELAQERMHTVDLDSHSARAL